MGWLEMCISFHGLDYNFSPFINNGIIMNYYDLLILAPLPLALYCRYKRNSYKGSGKLNPMRKWDIRMILVYWMIPVLVVMLLLSSCSPKTRPFRSDGDLVGRGK